MYSVLVAIYDFTLIDFPTPIPLKITDVSRPKAAFINLTPPPTPPSGGASGATRKVTESQYRKGKMAYNCLCFQWFTAAPGTP